MTGPYWHWSMLTLVHIDTGPYWHWSILTGQKRSAVHRDKQQCTLQWHTPGLVHIDTGPYWHWSILTLVHTDTGPYWHWSILTLVHIDTGPYWYWSILTLVHIDTGPYWQVRWDLQYTGTGSGAHCNDTDPGMLQEVILQSCNNKRVKRMAGNAQGDHGGISEGEQMHIIKRRGLPNETEKGWNAVVILDSIQFNSCGLELIA